MKKNLTTAFTLTELMISIALVLILIIGVNKVFKYTTDTVGTQAAVGSAMRDLRGAERTLRHDFDKMVGSTEQPSILIRSTNVYAFRNQQDAAADEDGLPQTDIDPVTGTAADFSIAANENRPSARRHRLDQISFFVRDTENPFKRQTGDTGTNTLIFNNTSPEAWIYLGPLWLPDNAGVFTAAGTPPPTYPGAGPAMSNPNNYYSSQWMFGRQSILMKSEAEITNLGEPYLKRAAGLTPLAYGSTAERKSAAGTAVGTIQMATCDLAGRTILEFHDDVLAVAGTATWWTSLLTNGAAAGAPSYMFQADPQGVKLVGGITSDSASKSSSVFMGSVSQFIVEYAGDFVTQNATTGAVTASVPDGIIDFSLIAGTGLIPERRMTQWYGSPRDTSGNPLGGPDNLITPLTGDVMPVATFAGAGTFPFEKEIPATVVPPLQGYYAAAFGPLDLDPTLRITGRLGGYAVGDVAVRKPAMIRIVVQIADAAGRLVDGQNLEYVFAAK